MSIIKDEIASWRSVIHNSTLKALRNPAWRNLALFNPVFLDSTWPWNSFSVSGTFEMLVLSHQIYISAPFLILRCHFCLSRVWLDYWSNLTFVMSSWLRSPLFLHYCWNVLPAGHGHLISSTISHLPGLWKDGEIWEMTQTMTAVCLCCHTVTSGCLSLRMWWAWFLGYRGAWSCALHLRAIWGRQQRWAKDYSPER